MPATDPPSGSSPPEEAPKQYVPKDWLAKISALSAVAAAILSAIVTLRVTHIQTDTQQLLAVREDSIKRAELFRELIQDLNDDSKSGYALLTLWKIYDEPKDRKVVVLAALENPNPGTIQTLERMGFEKELEGYRDTLERIAKSDTGGAEVANDIILKALSPISAARYLIDVLASSSNIEPHHENVQNLITLSEKNDAVMTLLAQQEETVLDRPLFAYIQYKAGKPSPFLEYLQDVQSDPEKIRIFSEFMTKITPEDLSRDDWPQIVETAIGFLTMNTPGTNDFSESVAFDLIYRNHFGGADLEEDTVKSIGDQSHRYFFAKKASDNTRLKALECLLSWDPSKTRLTVAEYLSCEGNFNPDKDLLTSFTIEEALNNDLVFKDADAAPEASKSDKWRQWFESNYPDVELNCKR